MGALGPLRKVRENLLSILCLASVAVVAAIVLPQSASAALQDYYECVSTDAGNLCRDKASGTWWRCTSNGSWSCEYYTGPDPQPGDKEILEGLLNTEGMDNNPRYAATIAKDYDPNGPFHVTAYAIGTRSSTGEPWSVTVAIDDDQATQSCASDATVCTASVGMYLTLWSSYSISAVVTANGVTKATAVDSVFAYCD